MSGTGDHPDAASAHEDASTGGVSEVSPQRGDEDDLEEVDSLSVSQWRIPNILEEESGISREPSGMSREPSGESGGSKRVVTAVTGNGSLGTLHEGAAQGLARMSSIEFSRMPSNDISRISSNELENEDKVTELETLLTRAASRADATDTRPLSPFRRETMSLDAAEEGSQEGSEEEEEEKDEEEVEEKEKAEPVRKPHNWKPHPWSLSWRQQHMSSMQALKAEQAAKRKSSSSEEEEEEEGEEEVMEEKQTKDPDDDATSTRIFRNENLDHFRSQKGDAWKALLPPPTLGSSDEGAVQDLEDDKIGQSGSFIRAAAAFSGSILRRFGSEDGTSPMGRLVSPHASMADMTGLFTRTVSAAIGVGEQPREERTPKVSPFLQKYNFAGPQEIDQLLKGLGVECDVVEKDILLKAFICPVCDFANEACTTIADQIRAVFDAFRLIDADEDGLITLSELRDIASWTLEGEGNEFINNLIKMLRTHGGIDPQEEEEEEELLISAKDFLLAFARCLEPDSELGTIEEILERRAVEYRKIGSLFGMEKVQQHFYWNKFLLTFFSDTLAVIAFPLCKILDYWRGGDEEEEEEEEARSGATLHDILTQSQWLPAPYNSFDAFQVYLMKLWVPSIFSVVCYFLFSSYMTHISVAEVLSPTIIYVIIGSYISTISGYEHPRMVLRRMNMSLSAQTKLNELQAIFAFRAHTPEGHMVDQIGSIADWLFAKRFQWMSNSGSALAGVLHGMMPTLHRVYYAEQQGADATCAAEQGGLGWTMTQVYFWLCGGHKWVHALVSIPSAFISGYLTYRLLFITCHGFYNDLAFYNRLKLFRAMTQAEPFLRYRARWIRGIKRSHYQGRREFLQFLNLQKRDDLVLWCRIRHLMVESYAGFRTKQGDVMVTFILTMVLVLTSYIFFFQMGRDSSSGMSVFDMRARADVFVFSLLLIIIINLKLSIHSLRKSDISLLHKEYYTASMSVNSGASRLPTADLKPKPVPQAGSRFAASFVRRKSICSNESGGWVSPMAMRGNPIRHTASATGFELPQGGDEGGTYGDFGGSRANLSNSRKGSRRPSIVEGNGNGNGHGTGNVNPPPPSAAERAAEQGVQKLLEHTARYIAEFDRPPRLLSFTVSIHFLRYIFLPLLSPIIAALRAYTGFAATRDHHHAAHHALNETNASLAVVPAT